MPKGRGRGMGKEPGLPEDPREKARNIIEGRSLPTYLPPSGFLPLAPLTVTEETRYSTVTLPRGRGVQCLQWYQLKRGRIPTVDEITRYRTQFTPRLASPISSQRWELY